MADAPPFLAPAEPASMSLVEHLEDLRRALLAVMGAWVVLSCACYAFGDRLVALLAEPVGKLVFLHPAEPFFVRMKVSFAAGAFLAFPVLLERGYRFVAPGLQAGERRLALAFVPSAYILFCLGAAFGWVVAVPAGLRFLLSFASPQLVPAVTLENYVTFVGTLLFAFGLMFQLPLLILALVRLGLVERLQLAAYRRHVLLGIVVVSALLTPGPDVFSQIALSLPTYLLYELALFVSRWFVPGRPREAVMGAARPAD